MEKIKIGNEIFTYNILYRSKKNIIIRVSKKNHLDISATRYTTKDEIFKVLAKNQKQILERNKNTFKKSFYDGKEVKIKKIDTNATPHIECKNGTLIYKGNEDLFDVTLQKFYANKTYELLENKVPLLYKKIDFFEEGMRSFVIKDVKSIWGSCRKNGITINYRLSMLPNELVDYILIHEVCHIKVPNHGSDFWQLMTKYLPNAKELDKKLNKFHF